MRKTFTTGYTKVNCFPCTSSLRVGYRVQVPASSESSYDLDHVSATNSITNIIFILHGCLHTIPRSWHVGESGNIHLCELLWWGPSLPPDIHSCTLSSSVTRLFGVACSFQALRYPHRMHLASLVPPFLLLPQFSSLLAIVSHGHTESSHDGRESVICLDLQPPLTPVLLVNFFCCVSSAVLGTCRLLTKQPPFLIHLSLNQWFSNCRSQPL